MSQTKTTFHAEPASLVPGDTRLRLTRAWEDLPIGTIVQPRAHGHDNVRGRAYREVSVIDGPRAGETVNGAF